MSARVNKSGNSYTAPGSFLWNAPEPLKPTPLRFLCKSSPFFFWQNASLSTSFSFGRREEISHHLGHCASWDLGWTGERSWLWGQEIYLSHMLWRLRGVKSATGDCLICRITEIEHPSTWVLLFILLECFVSRGNHLSFAHTKPHTHHPCCRPGLLSRKHSKRAQ